MGYEWAHPGDLVSETLPPGIDLRCADVSCLFAEVTGARIIHADPPWNYGGRENCRGDGTRSGLGYAVFGYDTVLQHLDAAYDCATDDAYLLLWTTWPHLALWLDAARAHDA